MEMQHTKQEVGIQIMLTLCIRAALSSYVGATMAAMPRTLVCFTSSAAAMGLPTATPTRFASHCASSKIL